MPKLLPTLTLLSTLVATAAGASPGYTTFDLPVDHRPVPITVHAWYPSTTGTEEPLGRNAVFEGITVRPDATPTEGRHPVVLMSHGSGGNAINIGWLAAELADAGFIVLAPNHPGSTSNDSIQSETIRIWDRPADLTAILDHMVSNPPANLSVDMTRVGVIGFSLGGHTALAMGGARVSKAAFVSYCDDDPAKMDCDWYADGRVDLTAIDRTQFERSNADPRIKAIVAIDPAFAQAYDESSLRDIHVPLAAISLGIEPPVAIDPTAIATTVPGATLHAVEDATHFSFLGTCRWMGSTIVMLALEDPICSETGKRERADIHREIGQRVLEFLTKTLERSMSTLKRS